LFGGTFDPVHQGHMALANTLLQQAPFSEIRLTPCQMPVHKQAPLFSAKQRLDFLKIAIAEQSGETQKKLIADNRELERASPSFTYETIFSLRNEFKDNSIALILGYDAWEHFASWKNWQDILTQAHIVVASRPGFQLQTATPLKNFVASARVNTPQELLKTKAGKIWINNNCQFLPSSSEIRQLLLNNFNSNKLTQLLCPGVLNTIRANHQSA
jgi:nicotinate-nucleotide adenylyltransferase